MRILFIGDIFGRPGRLIVKDRLPGIVRDHAIDVVIANGENSAAGFGITPALAEELTKKILTKRGLLNMAQTPAATVEALNGLVAFVVPGPDVYSIAQGQTSSSPQSRSVK